MSAQARPGAEPPYIAESDLLRRAHAFASAVHAGQRAKDGAPYITHPLAVAALVRGSGRADEVVAAALLHDAVEDSAGAGAAGPGGGGGGGGAAGRAESQDGGGGGDTPRRQAPRAH